jgi:hypothetical protein
MRRQGQSDSLSLTAQERTKIMSGIGWGILGIIYLLLMISLGILTFRKGHWILGLIGFIIPILWLIGAILPSRRYR